jgi:hypothetical protein
MEKSDWLIFQFGYRYREIIYIFPHIDCRKQEC